MSYQKKLWRDRMVEHPARFRQEPLEGGYVTLTPEPGQVTDEGTPFSAENMNHLEDGVANALPRDGGEMKNTLMVKNLNAEFLGGKMANQFANEVHNHGNMTSSGKYGAEKDRIIMTGTDGIAEAKTPEEFLKIIRVVGQNILHNADFRNPINQRKASGAINKPNSYFLDRWILTAGTVTLSGEAEHGQGYLTFQTGAEIEQRIEGQALAGATVTISLCEQNGTIHHISGNMPASVGVITLSIPNIAVITLGHSGATDPRYMYMRIKYTSSGNLSRCKMELGALSTLAYDTPSDPSIELTKCRRFYERCTSRCMRPVLNNYFCVDSDIVFQTEKRISPTLAIRASVDGPTGQVSECTLNGSFTAIRSVSYQAETDKARIWFGGLGGGYVFFYWEASADL